MEKLYGKFSLVFLNGKRSESTTEFSSGTIKNNVFHLPSDRNFRISFLSMKNNLNTDAFVLCSLSSGLTYQELEDIVEGDPHIVVIWK